MKKLFAKLALAMLPVAVYLCIFAAFDFYDYFGLQGSTNDNNPITRTKNYTADPADYIILGDSRMAHFDMAQVNQTSGHTYRNLSFGGATMGEALDLLAYARSRNPNLQCAVYGLSFYTLNQNYSFGSRMQTIETQLQNPVAYVSNLEYNLNMLNNMVQRLQGAPAQDAEETRVPQPDDYTAADGTALPYRKDLILYAASLYTKCAKPGTLPAVQYDENGNAANLPQLLAAMQNATPADSAWCVNEADLQRLADTAAECKAAGIDFYVVLPPMDASVRELVCEPLGITQPTLQALEFLRANGVQVLDYEWGTAAPQDTFIPQSEYGDEYFFDGFHMDTKRGLTLFCDSLFTRVA